MRAEQRPKNYPKPSTSANVKKIAVLQLKNV